MRNNGIQDQTGLLCPIWSRVQPDCPGLRPFIWNCAPAGTILTSGSVPGEPWTKERNSTGKEHCT